MQRDQSPDPQAVAVEAVARAICNAGLAREHWDDIGPVTREAYRVEARAAIAAHLAALAEAGMVVVPREPSAAMIRAMAESVAVDDEGEFPPMCDLLGFSGENKTYTVLRAAGRAMLSAHSGEGK